MNEDNGNSSDDRIDSVEFHRRFVSAILDIGTERASPSQILDHMTLVKGAGFDDLKLEQIKSHLQRFRKIYLKSHQGETMNVEKRAFLDEYDSFVDFGLDAAQAVSARDDDYRTIVGGRAIGLVSRIIMMDETTQGNKAESNSSRCPSPKTESRNHDSSEQQKAPKKNLAYPKLPVLTHDEKASYLGRSIDLVIGLLKHLNDYIEISRLGREEGVRNDPASQQQASQQEQQSQLIEILPPEALATAMSIAASVAAGAMPLEIGPMGQPTMNAFHQQPLQQPPMLARPILPKAQKTAEKPAKEIAFRKLQKTIFDTMGSHRKERKPNLGGPLVATRTDCNSSSELSSLSSPSSSEDNGENANVPLDSTQVGESATGRTAATQALGDDNKAQKSWIFDEFPSPKRIRLMSKSTGDVGWSPKQSSKCSCCSSRSASSCEWYIENGKMVPETAKSQALNEAPVKRQGSDESSDISSIGVGCHMALSPPHGDNPHETNTTSIRSNDKGQGQQQQLPQASSTIASSDRKSVV